ncbi:trypsin-like serine peptidase [Planococcus halocryophilus]|nr:serine protease [Planococcus halocryophilus]
MEKEMVTISDIHPFKNLENKKEKLIEEKERINEEALSRYQELLEKSEEKPDEEDVETVHETAKKIEARIENAEDLDGPALERIIFGNDLFPISYLQSGFNIGNSVCRIVLSDRVGRVVGYGTGFLISPSLIMTNNHVLDKEEVAVYSTAEFNYQTDENNVLCQSTIFRLDPDKLFITDKRLDFTIVAVQEFSGDNRRLTDFGHLKLSPNLNIMENEYVSIIQHPQGGHKAVTVRENRVKFLSEDFIHYVTDTQPGSSGSPVFNDQWVVVALHHSGVRDPNDRTQWVANEGIRISSILKHLDALIDHSE